MTKKAMMLKTAVAAAVISMSSGAMALTFTDGNFTGNVGMSGKVTVPTATNQWQWAAGDALVLDGKYADLTNGNKTLTIAAAQDIPILAGQTKAASVTVPGGTGITPVITMADAKNNPITLNLANSTTDSIVLPVTSDDGVTALGTLTLPIQTAGVLGFSDIGNNTGAIKGQYDSGAALGPFKGMVIKAKVTQTNGGSIALQWLNTHCGVTKTKADWVSDLAVQNPGFTGFTEDIVYSDDLTGANNNFVGAYGMAVLQGQNMVLNFTTTPTVTTKWRSAIKFTVSYL